MHTIKTILGWLQRHSNTALVVNLALLVVLEFLEQYCYDMQWPSHLYILLSLPLLFLIFLYMLIESVRKAVALYRTDHDFLIVSFMDILITLLKIAFYCYLIICFLCNSRFPFYVCPACQTPEIS